jgi:Protein of unknown function (DUF742)
VPGPGQADRPPVNSGNDPSARSGAERDVRPRPSGVPMMRGRSQLGSHSSESSNSQERAPLYQGSDSQKSALVRPYAVTGGRTQPRYQLQIEAMVAASHYGARDLSVLAPECQAILGFCRDWRSVAEISAVLRLPLGVSRVLVADMAVEGLVRVHQVDHAHGRPDLNLLERVLSGLHKL